MLSALRARANGWAKEFIGLLRKTFQQKVSSTEEFVELVGAEVSNEAKKKLESTAE